MLVHGPMGEDGLGPYLLQKGRQFRRRLRARVAPAVDLAEKMRRRAQQAAGLLLLPDADSPGRPVRKPLCAKSALAARQVHDMKVVLVAEQERRRRKPLRVVRMRTDEHDGLAGHSR